MPFYRTKPNTKEAWKFTNNFWEKAPMEFRRAVKLKKETDIWNGYIETLEGPHDVKKGDYIIKGLAGEFYPCREDIFEKSYEPVDTKDHIWKR